MLVPQVDGGLGPATIDEAAAAGANNIVAGSSVFKPGVDRREPIAAMRRSVTTVTDLNRGATPGSCRRCYPPANERLLARCVRQLLMLGQGLSEEDADAALAAHRVGN